MFRPAERMSAAPVPDSAASRAALRGCRAAAPVLAGPVQPPVKRAPRDKRQRILDAAVSVFARTGYHGARVSDIAREAGIAYGLVYHYFKNKEEILDTIFEERWTGFLEAVEGIAESAASTEDRLLSIAALVLSAYRLRPEWVRVLVFEIQRSPRFADPERIRAVGRLFALVARILREGQQRGEVRAGLDPEIACTVFIGSLDLIVTSRVLRVLELDEETDEREYYLRAARTVVDVFLRGIAADARSGGP
jgi:TetR/AcrR family transcriptional regulator, fatty acid metabolism regulator protein